MNFLKYIIIIIVCCFFAIAQNEVCFDIDPNPNPFDIGLNSFTKYVNVLDCFKIYA